MKGMLSAVAKGSLLTLALALVADPAFADDAAVVHASSVSHQKFGAAIGIALAVIGGAVGQGKAVAAMLEAYGRNPAVGGKLFTPLLLGLALIESLVILAFVICIQLA
jgi:F-type H+-transporting ATPase subunit c